MPGNMIIFMNFPPGLDASYAEKGSIYPCTASMLIGTFLKNHGYEVRIIDGAYHSDYLTQLSDLLNNNEVLYVGMTVMTSQIPFALEASAVIKNCGKKIPVIWGGPHPTLFPEMTLAHPNVDNIVINEGTNTSQELAEFYNKGGNIQQIRGIGYKTEQNQLVFTPPRDLEDINQLPYFDFSLIDVNKYLNPSSESIFQREFPFFKSKVKALPIMTALGCPYRCQFCINVILKRKYRFRSAESIVDEIKRLVGQYDVNTFYFLDEDFFVNKNRVMEFVSLVEKEGLHFNWRMLTRVDHYKDNYINKELIRRLEKIGYGSIVSGAESANQEMLDDLQKGITVDQIQSSIELLAGSTIIPRYGFMVGLENESFEQIKKTYQFCLKLVETNPNVDIAGPFIFRLYPGSPIYQRLNEKYQLNIPSSLDEWAQYLRKEDIFTKLPWTPMSFHKNIKTIVFYADHAYEKIPVQLFTINYLLRIIVQKLSRLRIKTFIFTIPFEFWLVSWYRRRKTS